MFIEVSGYFSDESIIAVLDDRAQTVRRRPNEEFLPEGLKKTVKFLTKLLFGGAISVFLSFSCEYLLPFPVSFLWY